MCDELLLSCAIKLARTLRSLLIIFIDKCDERSRCLENELEKHNIYIRGYKCCLRPPNIVCVKIRNDNELFIKFTQIYGNFESPLCIIDSENGNLLFTWSCLADKDNNLYQLDKWFSANSRVRFLTRGNTFVETECQKHCDFDSEIQATKDCAKQMKDIQLKFTTANDTENKSKDCLFSKRRKMSDTSTSQRRIHLQMQMEGRSATVMEFKGGTMMAEVRNSAADHYNLSLGTFKMITPYPKREFEDADFNKTLDELSLWPSAMIYIRLINDPNSSGSGLFSSNRLLNIFSRAKSHITRLLPDQQGSQNNSMTDKIKSKTSVRLHGNIYGLHDESSDDDQHTDNGNSTQQK